MTTCRARRRPSTGRRRTPRSSSARSPVSWSTSSGTSPRRTTASGPATGVVGTHVPETWRLDGYAELRFDNLRAILTAPLHQREIFYDEQNAFARVLGRSTAPGGGRWWTTGHDDTVGHRVTLLLRRRRGIRRSTFQQFVYKRLAPALLTAGAQDLRAYTFLPWSRLVNTTVGVAHDNPINRRYHALVTFGLDNRADVDTLLAAPQLANVIADQHTVLTAAHAFGIERSVPVVRTDL